MRVDIDELIDAVPSTELRNLIDLVHTATVHMMYRNNLRMEGPAPAGAGCGSDPHPAPSCYGSQSQAFAAAAAL